jgi:hypothetical protein
MFRPGLTKSELRDIVDEMSELDVARFLYCQEMAGTYLAVGQFEDMLISAMHMCDRVKLELRLGSEFGRWDRALAKRSLLQNSTLGTLIKILQRHGVFEVDINYLKWIKDKRDYFIHRLFHQGGWPSDLDERDCRLMARRLIAIQLWLQRAARNVWLIFERAGFVELDRLGDGGLVAMNSGIRDLLEQRE